MSLIVFQLRVATSFAAIFLCFFARCTVTGLATLTKGKAKLLIWCSNILLKCTRKDRDNGSVNEEWNHLSFSSDLYVFSLSMCLLAYLHSAHSSLKISF